MSYSDYHDDFITARNITPPLERVDPRYRHESTPPPLVSADESDSVCSIGERSHKGDDGIVVGSRSASKPTHQRQKRRKRHHGRQSRPPLLGNEVLLMNLAPGRPDIVRELAQTDLNSGSDEEGEESEDERGTRNGDRVDHAQFQHVRDEPRRRPMTNGHANDGVDYMDLDDEEDFSDTQKSSIPETSRSMSHQSTVNSSSVNGIAQPHALVGSPTDFSASRAPLNLLPPPLPLNRLSPRSPLSIDPRQVKEEENETSVISPNLGGFLISSADGNPDDMLPPISPPRSVTEFSFDILTRLPSLQTTIDMEMMGSPRSYSMSAGSPTHWHPYGASPLPFSAPSPGYSYPTPGASMQAKHHPFRTRENSTGMAASSEPSDYSISTPNSVATPATSVSTSSYATSIGIKSEYQHQRTISQPMLVAHHHAWQSPTEPFQTRDINGFHAPPWKPDSQAIGQKRKTAPLLPTLSTSSRTSTAAEPSSKLKSACKTESKTSSPNRDPSRALTAKTTISPVDTTGPSNELPSASSSHNNIYRCTFPTCTAAPFGTQYLLNSHANVHSFSRPHYCSEPGCNRGPGGMGFKRKNEMIRHGLVHRSPGYVCPFCPDQQHRYPRPDNLQRHVRMHHVEKEKDDPALKAVLALKPSQGQGQSEGDGRDQGQEQAQVQISPPVAGVESGDGGRQLVEETRPRPQQLQQQQHSPYKSRPPIPASKSPHARHLSYDSYPAQQRSPPQSRAAAPRNSPSASVPASASATASASASGKRRGKRSD